MQQQAGYLCDRRSLQHQIGRHNHVIIAGTCQGFIPSANDRETDKITIPEVHRPLSRKDVHITKRRIIIFAQLFLSFSPTK